MLHTQHTIAMTHYLIRLIITIVIPQFSERCAKMLGLPPRPSFVEAELVQNGGLAIYTRLVSNYQYHQERIMSKKQEG